MGKRNTLVVLSSDDEVFYTKSKLKSASVPRAKPRRAKKPRISSYSSQSYTQSNGFDELKLLCKELGEGFTGFKVSTGSGRSDKDLWVDKYKPHSMEDLAVHKKKVEEVKAWLEERLRTSTEEVCNNSLLITGQAGVGKSATIDVIASHLGATVCEWKTPTPTIWQEHLHTSNSGMRYMSKLDEFENFVESTRKYGFISSSVPGGSQAPAILLIDDIPAVNGKVAYQRLYRCLMLLVQSIRIPTVILLTDYGKDHSSDYTSRCFEELQSSLQGAGAYKVAFNLITVNSIKKILNKICKQEQCKVTAEEIDLIAKASGGDIRHAITSLQYFCLKPQSMLSLSFSNSTPTNPIERLDEISRLDDGFSLPFGRDETLSLFHALGKFLHNKRDTENSTASGNDAFLLRDKYLRLPLKMDAPEKVLCQAHGQARSIADFLHENGSTSLHVLDFMNEEAIGDASVVSSYLSDADSLLASLNGMLTRNFEADNIVQSTAASVAVRGVLFGNFYPLTSRWHAIRRPNLWQVEQSLRHNKREMVNERCNPCNGPGLTDLSVIATERQPVLKWIGFRASQCFESQEAEVSEASDDEDDDEIEDW